MSASRDRVMAIAEPVVTEAGYDLEDLTVMAAGRRRQVRVIISSDHGVDLDEAAAVSRAVSEALDDSGAMGETPYVLEVTSPGVDRPLTLPRHWRRARTRLVKILLTDETSITGRVVSFDDAEVTLSVEEAAVVVPFTTIEKAIVQVEFNRREYDAAQTDDSDSDSDDEPDSDSEPDGDSEPDHPLNDETERV